MISTAVGATEGAALLEARNWVTHAVEPNLPRPHAPHGDSQLSSKP